MKRKTLYTIIVVTLAVLASVIFFRERLINLIRLELPSDTDLLMAGEYNPDTIKPFLLSINSTNFSVNKIDLSQLGLSGFNGIHKAHAFMVDGLYKMALGTYADGKLLILGSSKPSINSLRIEFEDDFPQGERVRAVYPGDIDGDGAPEVVVGTRPSGILRYYKYSKGKWTATEIDKVGATIHDILIVDSDGDGRKEIFATTSTVEEYKDFKLQVKIPEIIKYTLSGSSWKKEVVWKPEKPILNDAQVYNHARYIFGGDFDGDGKTELVSGVVGSTTLQGLLVLKWDGSGYSEEDEDLGSGVGLNIEVIAEGNIDNNGKSEIIVPTLLGDTFTIFKRQGGKWERSTLFKGDVNENTYNEYVISMAILNSESGGRKEILYSTFSNNPAASGYPKFYILSYDTGKSEWVRTLVNQLNLPQVTSWGIYPMSSWKLGI